MLLYEGFPERTPVSVQPQAKATAPYLVVISIDGLVPDYYLNPDRFGLKIPTIRRLRNKGAFADGVIGVYPSVTYPAHTTMVTGAKPKDHGIYSNRIFEEPTAPQTGRWYWWANAIKSDTLWAAARRAGLRTAAIGWPVTVGAEIDYNLPEIWEPGIEDQSTIETVRRHTTPGLLEEVLKAAQKLPSAYASQDDMRTDAAVYILTHYRPNLLLLHLIDLDGVHHRSGPHSKAAYEEAEKQDGRVKRVLEAISSAGIEEQTTIVIVSDHGFMPVEREFHPGVLLARAGFVKHDDASRIVDWQAAILSHGGSAAVILREGGNEGLARAVRKIFSDFAREPASPIARIVEKDELERLGADPHAAFFIEAASFCVIGGDYRGEPVRLLRERHPGAHGYLPDRPQMRASLILAGSGINSGVRVPIVKMTDLAPTLAAILGVDLKAPAYSRPVASFLVQERKQKIRQVVHFGR